MEKYGITSLCYWYRISWFCGAFLRLAVQVSELRKDGSAFRRRVPITVEVALIALVTAITGDVEKNMKKHGQSDRWTEKMCFQLGNM